LSIITTSIITPTVILTFCDGETEDLFNGVDSLRARRKCHRIVWPVARRKLTQLNRVRNPEELAVPLRNRMRPGQACREGRQAIRITERFRVCFRWEDGHAHDVEVVG
jgi:proteic killer suppression protein